MQRGVGYSSPEEAPRRRTPVRQARGGSAAPKDPTKIRKMRGDETKGMGQVGGRSVTGVHRDLKNMAADSATPASKLGSPGAWFGVVREGKWRGWSGGPIGGHGGGP